ncbi:alpha-1,4-glucan--maltose-1-phosphate maltosyltransferase [Hyunsoonleella pacifica]|uniref:Alpha-1,4-glucan:maltose-1-phosphate maltosyltransferase n=1 Tax=Hyunsoonleella pacifica TaxID=1080224 RepID=A0A4Q9FSF9_9FLAO|nr:alpha-1,4-glucan--maltose-1-phosphate maltosyltransferase [Hyunsoonleella pacifica]TBN16657.1 alpha-1,4-glucan--maltose-1-phosphate maltosyltransferase [Hyunsoonleella pacifica]GGD17618.1 alpha-1,4-glucan:maltose-1-phosphate maltosyltransferase [Hyunsoonleella pacifica]
MKNQRRVVVDYVSPSVNGGEFYIKRIVNEVVNVRAHILADGHDVLGASVCYKHENGKKWNEARMSLDFNNEWQASFFVEKQGYYTYKVEAWVDYTLNWRHGIIRKIDDGQYVISELLEGADYIEAVIKKVSSKVDKAYLEHLQNLFKDESKYDEAVKEATSERLYQIFYNNPIKLLENTSTDFQIYVDRKKARFSTWYEFFPRSASEKEGVHGTFKDCERLLPRIKNMGFDVVYLPPIHPIGEVNRKGKNNTTEAKEGDVGSTWGVGSKYGGHKAIHPQLGNLEDFKALVKKAKEQGLEIAMDYALQAAPDHPWVKAHPKWFKWRPDGTVQYAENPPKKYQDILPIYWESEEYEALWQECLDILLHWIDCGIEIFRVDNPHTKPFYFWNWIITKVKEKHPNVIFLAEAFTAPKVMQQLAKQGYTQSYTYFTWRNNKHELIDYVEELTKTELKEYMQPNFWPNTPDINPFHLQGTGDSKHMQRYALAATLSSCIGIYGPVFEYMLSDSLLGKEEYLNSEKFQITHYDWTIQNKLTTVIAKINFVRHHNEALQQTNNIKFCYVENDNLIAFYKWNEAKTNHILVVISLDHHNSQQGTIQMPLYELGVHEGHLMEMHDLITDNRYNWHNEWNFVELHPALPFHIFQINK